MIKYQQMWCKCLYERVYVCVCVFVFLYACPHCRIWLTGLWLRTLQGHTAVSGEQSVSHTLTHSDKRLNALCCCRNKFGYCFLLWRYSKITCECKTSQVNLGKKHQYFKPWSSHRKCFVQPCFVFFIFSLQTAQVFINIIHSELTHLHNTHTPTHTHHLHMLQWCWPDTNSAPSCSKTTCNVDRNIQRNQM